VKRTKSGQISRAKDAYNENAAGIALRMKVFGLSEADARDQKAATYVGRLCLAGRKATTDGVTEAQYEAAMAYREAYEAFQRAVKSPDALRTGNGSSGGGEGPEYAGWCQRSIARWDGIQKAVYAEQEIHGYANMWAALDYIVCRDQQLAHLLGDLRLALNAIGHHLGMTPKPKRKAVDTSPQIAA
jgi:hypothetical protein